MATACTTNHRRHWRNKLFPSGALPAFLGCAFFQLCAAADYVPSSIKPPAVTREFRGVWVASVKNIDWPSQPGLTTVQQKAELIALLDRAAQLKLNAVFLQIRPACDALYASQLEPWSEYLTGRMGQSPAPFYDPLEFAIEEAHRRGLQLHAWFNPFRARHAAGTSSVARNHISKTRPALAKTYGKSLWLDPGESAVQEHCLQVVVDVVRRYDIDGVHFDDYFYPYEEKDARGNPIPFPDWASWNSYRNNGGRLSKDDWRRQNVNTFVLRVGRAVKAQKPWVQYGISPFGIWRPGHPPQIRGFDAYDGLYADARKWFAEGWLDYLAPQLYWPTAQAQQSFPVLLKWWSEQNAQRRHLWPGISLGNEPAEVVNQIRLTRKQPGASGDFLWSAKALVQNRRGISTLLVNNVYAEPALVPDSPWMDRAPLATPRLTIDDGARVSARWSAGNTPAPMWWILQSRVGLNWSTEILPGHATSRIFDSKARPDVITVTAADRLGATSAPAVMEHRIAPPPVSPVSGEQK